MNGKLPDVLSMMRTLIAQPSVSCTDPRLDQANFPVIHSLADWLEKLGFSVQVIPLSTGKANLLATLGGGIGSGLGLVFSGHTDTVPFDEGAWSVDPFGGVERDQRIYGLGSCDMKSFFALVLAAAQEFDAKRFKHPLTVLATADEESTMSGARYLCDHGLKPGRYAVIGEPTGLRPIRMHKGVMMESLRVTGHAGHSSDPALGANAIEGMQRILGELLIWRQELQARHRNPAFAVDTPTLNLGAIRGGDNPNRICGHCELQIDIRPLPGMEIEALRQALYDRLSTVLVDSPGLRLETSPLFAGVPPFETARNSAIVRACEDISGLGAGAVAFGTEAPYLSSLGTETVVFGPGDIRQAHQPDEYLALSQIKPSVDMFKRLIGRFCLE
jgi:acetylornithine deacetylase